MIDYENAYYSEDVDLGKISKILFKNKNTIAIFGVLGILISGFIAFTTKRTWEGQFQIVLDNQENNSMALLDNLSQQFEGLTGSTKTNQIKTEVGILKSPSVLMSIFEYVKESKSPESQDLRFWDWKRSLEIKLEDGTSILNLRYKDNNKSLILPVLNRISSKYQEFSGRKRKRGLELSMDFFDDQVKLYKDKSLKSNSLLQEYSIEHNLRYISSIDSTQVNQNAGQNKQSLFVAVEAKRVELVENLDYYKSLYEEIISYKDNKDKIVYIDIGRDLKQDSNGNNYLLEIFRVNSKLSELRQIYTINDKVILKLQKEKNLLINNYYNYLLGIVKSKIGTTQAFVKSYTRPKAVLIKYRNLLTQALRDTETLNSLENQYRNLSLEGARAEDPWELITKPTLLPYPVAPKRKQSVMIGFITGIITGIIYSLIIERKRNIIYGIEELKSIPELPFIAEFNCESDSSLEESVNLVSKGILSTNSDAISLFSLDKDDDKYSKKIFALIRNNFPNRDIIINSDLLEFEDYSNLILIISLSTTNRDDLIETLKNLSILKKSALGIFVLRNKNK